MAPVIDCRSRTLCKSKQKPCPSPVGKLIASLEARLLADENHGPLSPEIIRSVDKVLADGGDDLGGDNAGLFSSLSWLLRIGKHIITEQCLTRAITEVFELVGEVCGSLGVLTVSCKALYGNSTHPPSD